MSISRRTRALLLAPALLAGGCIEPGYEIDPSKESQITSLYYEPAHTEEWTGPPCLVSIENACILQTTYTEDVPDVWTMTVRQCDDGFRQREDNECSTATFEISEIEFSTLAVGNVVRYQDEGIVRVPQ